MEARPRVDGALRGERRARPGLLGTAGPAGAARDQDVKDAWREVHRPGEQSREKENRLVLRRVAPLAPPGIVLLAARPLPRHHVRVGAPLPGVVNRLVDVQHDAVLLRRLRPPWIVAPPLLFAGGVA